MSSAKQTVKPKVGERTIWKFPLDLKDVNHIYMPKDAKILSVQVQRGIPCVWAMVNPDAPVETRAFLTIGTGAKMPIGTKLTYISTYQYERDGVLVFHIFEEEVA